MSQGSEKLHLLVSVMERAATPRESKQNDGESRKRKDEGLDARIQEAHHDVIAVLQEARLLLST